MLRHLLPGYQAMLHAAYLLPLALGSAAPATAQVIDTEYLLPLPGGTNIIELSGAYNNANSFHFSTGQTIPHTTTDDYAADFRYAHYFDIYGYTAGLQVFQSAGYVADSQFNGRNDPGIRTLGVSNTTLSAFAWPYANEEQEAYVFTAAYVTPPDGSYAPNRVSIAYGGWQGDLQAGAVKGFGEFSLQAAFDVQFHGNEQLDGGAHLSVDPTYRLQIWAIHEWSESFGTSIGYTGVFGGASTNVSPGFSDKTYLNDERQRIRAEATYWWNRHTQTSLEVAHDIAVGGGFQSVIDAEVKVRLLF